MQLLTLAVLVFVTAAASAVPEQPRRSAASPVPVWYVGPDTMGWSKDNGATWNTSYFLDWDGSSVFHSFRTTKLLFGPEAFYGDGIAVGYDRQPYAHVGYIWRRNASAPTQTVFPGDVIVNYTNAGWNNSYSRSLSGGVWFGWQTVEVVNYYRAHGPRRYDGEAPQSVKLLLGDPSAGLMSFDLVTEVTTELPLLCGTSFYPATNNITGGCSIGAVKVIEECDLALAFGLADQECHTLPSDPSGVGCSFYAKASLKGLRRAMVDPNVNGSAVWNAGAPGIPAPGYIAWKMWYGHHVNCTHIYAIFGWNGTMGLMASTDGGATFDRVAYYLEPPNADQWTVTFEFLDNDVIYALAQDNNDWDGTETTAPKLSRSSDGGLTWQPIAPVPCCAPSYQTALWKYMDVHGVMTLYNPATIASADGKYMIKVASEDNVAFPTGNVLRMAAGTGVWSSVYEPPFSGWAGELVPTTFFLQQP